MEKFARRLGDIFKACRQAIDIFAVSQFLIRKVAKGRDVDSRGWWWWKWWRGGREGRRERGGGGGGQHEDERAETRAGARAGAERCGKDAIFASSVLYRSQGHVWLGEETC